MKAFGNGKPQQCVANLINLYQYEVPYARLKGMDPSIIDTPTEDAETVVKNHVSTLIENYEPRVTINDITIAYSEDNKMVITPDITVNEVWSQQYKLVDSEAFAPIGAGLQNYQTQVYENCLLEFNSLDEQKNGYNQWGPLYVHGPGDPTARNCALVIDSCTCIAEKGTKAITLPDVAGSLQYKDIPVTIRRTIGVTNGNVITDVSKATHKLTNDSALNNVSSWNY